MIGPPLRPWGLALASAVLLILAFPSFNQPWAAWVALVPWLILLRGGSTRAAFWWSYGIGLAFFLGSIWWLIHVTLIGWLVLCAYLALYFGAFGLFASVVVHRSSRLQAPGSRPEPLPPASPARQSSEPGRASLEPPATLLISSLWVALEYARSHLLSGFGWNLLAYSQSAWPVVIQFADVSGAWGISYVVVLVNVALAELVRSVSAHSTQHTAHRAKTARAWGGVTVAMGSVLIVFGYGTWRIRHLATGPTVRVAVVQGNIPQEQKWDEVHQEGILRRYEALTRAAADTNPDLIVWPETSVPGYLGLEDSLTTGVTDLARAVQVPLLVGAPRVQLEEGRVTNAAALVRPDGTIAPWHEKLHLVPFGEFIPFERWAPWLRQALPPIGDFAPGHHSTVFHVGSGLRAHLVPSTALGARQGSEPLPPAPPARQSSEPGRASPQPPAIPFSVLVCFEDIFPGLSRRFVRDGARLLLVITNDAWFGPTAAASQHTQASIFRAVELRVPVARAANTGWSGCIDASGRIHGSVRDPTGRELFVEGFHTCELPLRGTMTVYAALGDWLPLVCLLGIVGWWFLSKVTVTFGPK